MKKLFRDNAAFIVIMSLFVAACAVITAVFAVREPLYIEITPREFTTAAAVTGTEPLININSATVEELQALPGIGEVIAVRIVECREQIGGFGAIEEIMQVSGIGERTFENIRGLITV